VVIAVDLHVDFVGSGAMAADGSVEVSVKLADLIRQQQTEPRQGLPGAFSVKVVVEGRLWGEHPPFHPDSPFPPHCEGTDGQDLAAALVVRTGACHVWEFCPAIEGEVLSAKADGKGQLFTLEHALSFGHPPARVDVAGLSVEHATLELAEAVGRRYRRAGTQTVFWPNMSTFLHPEQASDQILRLQKAGVIIDEGDQIT